MWYRNVIGGGSAPIVDTWWQTETGAIMVSPLPGITTLMPGSAQVALPGVNIKVLDDAGKELGREEQGLLAITQPWPSMLRGIWGDPDRYKETYWSKFDGVYFAGDGAKYDSEGNIWVLGRVDDNIKVSGHLLSTAEIESALVSHPYVAEAAVVGAKDETTGQAVVAFVILRQDQLDAAGSDADVSKVLRDHVNKEIGPIARPRTIMVVAELPKTRSGKIMRRLLRDVAEDRPVGDVTTLADTSVMDIISGKIAGGASD
jgi:acetyl-CoA synthetase